MVYRLIIFHQQGNYGETQLTFGQSIRRLISVGGKKDEEPKLLTIGKHITCLAAADDWLNQSEDEETAFKTRTWLREEPTEKQISILPDQLKLDYNLTRYEASSHITFQLNKQKIKNLISKKRR